MRFRWRSPLIAASSSIAIVIYLSVSTHLEGGSLLDVSAPGSSFPAMTTTELSTGCGGYENVVIVINSHHSASSYLICLLQYLFHNGKVCFTHWDFEITKLVHFTFTLSNWNNFRYQGLLLAMLRPYAHPQHIYRSQWLCFLRSIRQICRICPVPFSRVFIIFSVAAPSTRTCPTSCSASVPNSSAPYCLEWRSCAQRFSAGMGRRRCSAACP